MGIGRDHYGDITMNPAPESTSPGAEALELRYLGRLAFEVGAVSLSGIDPALTTNDPRERLRLEAVYTRLRTRTLDTVDREPSSGSDPARGLREGRDALSALAMLDRSPRLVLLGGPGSGKSTFLNFVALCQAGERLGLAEVAARRLTRTSYPGEVAGGATSGVWALAERLCFREPDAPEATLEDAWGAHLAGQAVVESGAPLCAGRRSGGSGVPFRPVCFARGGVPQRPEERPLCGSRQERTRRSRRQRWVSGRRVPIPALSSDPLNSEL